MLSLFVVPIVNVFVLVGVIAVVVSIVSVFVVLCVVRLENFAQADQFYIIVKLSL